MAETVGGERGACAEVSLSCEWGGMTHSRERGRGEREDRRERESKGRRGRRGMEREQVQGMGMAKEEMEKGIQCWSS